MWFFFVFDVLKVPLLWGNKSLDVHFNATFRSTRRWSPCCFKVALSRFFISWMRADGGTNSRLQLRQQVLVLLPSTNDRCCNCFPACEDGPPEDRPGRNPVFGVLIKYWSLAESTGLQQQEERGGAAGFHIPHGFLFYFLSFFPPFVHLNVTRAHGWHWCARVGEGWAGESLSHFPSAVWKPVCTKGILMEGRGKSKENERFWVKALDLLSGLNTPLGVSANVKVTSGCGQTA